MHPALEAGPLLVLLSVKQVEESEARAVAAERERCARIAARWSKERRADGICDQECGWGIAKEIREGE